MFSEYCNSKDKQTVKQWLWAMSLSEVYSNVCSPCKAADFQRVVLTDVSWLELRTSAIDSWH